MAKRGFTLIELLIVMAILTLLAGISVHCLRWREGESPPDPLYE